MQYIFRSFLLENVNILLFEYFVFNLNAKNNVLYFCHDTWNLNMPIIAYWSAIVLPSHSTVIIHVQFTHCDVSETENISPFVMFNTKPSVNNHLILNM